MCFRKAPRKDNDIDSMIDDIIGGDADDMFLSVRNKLLVSICVIRNLEKMVSCFKFVPHLI